MKKIFGMLLFCLLLAAGAATAMAAGYGTASYVRHGADGGIDAVLRLYETQDGTFAQVTVYDAQDNEQPLLAAVGRLNNGTLLLDDYEQKHNGKVTKYTTFGGKSYINGQTIDLPYPQLLLCELRLDADKAVLLPTINDRELGSSSVGSPDICGSYNFVGEMDVLSGQMALYFLQQLHIQATALQLRPDAYSYSFGNSADEAVDSPMHEVLGMHRDNYNAVYVYKNGKLQMKYYVNPVLWDAYRVTPTGEVLLLVSNEAQG